MKREGAKVEKEDQIGNGWRDYYKYKTEKKQQDIRGQGKVENIETFKPLNLRNCYYYENFYSR